MTDARPLLEVQVLHAGYDGSPDVVCGASLHVGRGEIVCVVGPARAGKSTLLKALYGLAHVSRGRVLFNDRDITNIQPREALRSAGITFVPTGSSLFPRMTVQENLELGMHLARDAALVRQRLAAVYDLFPRLAGRARTLAGATGRAEQRLLEIGRALMWSPRMLVVDGMAPEMAPDVAQETLATIRRLNEETGLTVLMAERDGHPGLSISDRGYLLEGGRQTYEGTGEELGRFTS
ncbi:ABC transporter ATP-binding protein [soil metagenome]